MKTDCNGRYVYLNPRRGGMIAVAEAARNVVCVGATPVGITNCLHFGNPYKPEVYWQFKEAVAGIGEACRALDTPVTGGNVSFYNESPSASVYPTPVIGMLGVIDDLRYIPTIHFKDAGDSIILLGKTHGHIGGSEYLSLIHGEISGDCPPITLSEERALQTATLEAIRSGIVKSAHDCAEGGLAVALAECCFGPDSLGVGASVTYHRETVREDFLLFGEDQSRILLSVSPGDVQELLMLTRSNGVTAEVLGEVTLERTLRINGSVYARVEELLGIYERAIEDRVSG